MAFDGFVLQRIVQELTALVGLAVEGAYLLSPHAVWIGISGGRDLLLSCSPETARIGRPEPGARSQGTGWHPKRFAGAQLVDARQEHQDRVLALEFRRPDQLGGETCSLLLLELTGRNSNVILVDPDSGRIVDALRRVTAQMSQRRQILSGKPYQPPPGQSRVDPATCDAATFQRGLASAGGQTVLDGLVRTLPLASRPVARFVAHEAGVPAGRSLGEVDTGAVRALHQSAGSLYATDLSLFVPCLLLDEHGQPEDFSLVPPLWLPSDRVVYCGSMLDAVDRYFGQRVARVQAAQLQQELAKAIQRDLAATCRKIERLNLELERAESADDYRIKGEVLTANLSQIRRGPALVELVNFYDPSGGKISIGLDPRLSPAANAQRYFKLYRKARDGRRAIARQLVLAKARQSRDEAYRARLAECADIGALEGLGKDLARDQVIKRAQHLRGKRRSGPEEAVAARRYVTSDGWTVLVGRSDKQNDLLTHRIAARTDLWFHAQGSVGSHVILRREGKKGEPSSAAILQAAQLAAYWSKARGSSAVPVNYTEARYVTKPRKAKPGLAAVRFEKTIFVEPRLIAEVQQ